MTELAEKRRRNTSATAAATSQPERLQRERERERERGRTEKPGQPFFFYWRNEKFENDVILEDFNRQKSGKIEVNLPDLNIYLSVSV